MSARSAGETFGSSAEAASRSRIAPSTSPSANRTWPNRIRAVAFFGSSAVVCAKYCAALGKSPTAR